MTNAAFSQERARFVSHERQKQAEISKTGVRGALRSVSLLLVFRSFAFRGFFALASLFALASAGLPRVAAAQKPAAAASKSHLGFDRNGYPGDDRLAALHRSFAYAGYWLNVPPGAKENDWTGKRALLRARGFGFLILFNGRLDAALLDAARGGRDPAALGRTDARAAAAAAAKEGFPPGAIVFLDQEEGGRLLPEQRAYIFAWVEEMRRSRYRPGVYCSGIEVPDGASRISTAEDILNHAKQSGKSLALWVANDQCPPSPGCSVAERPAVSAAGIPQALVWQYAQSPRRPQFTSQCALTYAPDGNCYAPALPHDAGSFVDLDVSASADPSAGR